MISNNHSSNSKSNGDGYRISSCTLESFDDFAEQTVFPNSLNRSQIVIQSRNRCALYISKLPANSNSIR